MCGQILCTGLQLSQGISSLLCLRAFRLGGLFRINDLAICFPSMLCPALWHQDWRQQPCMVPAAGKSEESLCSWYLTCPRQNFPCPACSAKVTLAAPLQCFVFQHLFLLKVSEYGNFPLFFIFPPFEFSLCINLLLQAVACSVIMMKGGCPRTDLALGSQSIKGMAAHATENVPVQKAGDSCLLPNHGVPALLLAPPLLVPAVKTPSHLCQAK